MIELSALLQILDELRLPHSELEDPDSLFNVVVSQGEGEGEVLAHLIAKEEHPHLLAIVRGARLGGELWEGVKAADACTVKVMTARVKQMVLLRGVRYTLELESVDGVERPRSGQFIDYLDEAVLTRSSLNRALQNVLDGSLLFLSTVEEFLARRPDSDQ